MCPVKNCNISKASIFFLSIPKGPKVRLVTAQNLREEAAFAAKEIVRQVGGVDMLQAHEAAEEDREEKKSVE